MKKNAIVRIVIWSVLIVTLIGILIYSINNQENMGFKLFNISINESTVSKYEDADSYSIGNTVIESEFDGIDIDWVNGEVKLVPYGEKTVKIEENCDEELKQEYELRWKTENGRLIIKPCESGAKAKKFPEKRLVVYIPKEMVKDIVFTKFNSISANFMASEFDFIFFVATTTSGDVILKDCKVADLKADSTSGDLILNNCTTDTAQLDTTSGKINVTGTASLVIADSTSGEILISTDNAPKAIKADSTSGKVTLELPENDGFTLEYDTTTGTLHNDFEAKNEDGKIIYGNGVNEYEIDTTSSNLYVKRK